MTPRKVTRKVTPAELRRFEDLAIIKYDNTKPLEVRAKASAELSRWTQGKPPDIVCGALFPIWKNETKPIEVRTAAYCALLELAGHEKSREWVCLVFRGLRNLPGDVAVCSKCGKQVDHEMHGGDHVGIYCGVCCPACSLIPREHLKEIPMTEEFGGDLKDIAREIVGIIRTDHSNISSGVN